MVDYYEVEIIPIILNKFKVSNIIVSGNSNIDTINQALVYCDNNNIPYTIIDSQKDYQEKSVYKSSLNHLSELNNYDAVFLNGDANWYTVFNELKSIKQNNNEFPLVFISHNIFPNKRRDSYIDPDKIPKEYLHEFDEFLPYVDENAEIPIYDGFYHAIEENTPKNGVLTAIEDFIAENSNINILDIKLLDGTIILYSNNNINYFRVNSIKEETVDFRVMFEHNIDLIIENQMLINYIDRLDISKQNQEDIISNSYQSDLKKKDKIINYYEEKIQSYVDEISYKNSQINNFNSKLDLKDAQIKNFESKIYNKNNEIDDLNIKLDNANNQIESLKENNELIKKNFNDKKSDLTRQIDNANNQIDSLRVYLSETENNFTKREYQLINQVKVANDLIKKNEIQLKEKDLNISQINEQISLKNQILKEHEISLNFIKDECINQLSQLDNKEYCITCYKEKITNNQLEIEYLKKNSFIKKLFSPLAYVYLLFKSKPHDWALNFKLYSALKNSECFDIGYYLTEYDDILDSKWCKYFSPELHYVCNGFNEKRKFNKKYFNRNSKKDLLNYILNCK